MSITSVYPNVTPYVGNPAVDLVRRENLRRDIIEPVAQMERGAAEKGVISEDKSRNSPQFNNPTYSDELKNRGTELKQAVEGRSERDQENNDGGQGSEQQQAGGKQQEAGSEERKLEELKQRDAEVKAHEQAHAGIGGNLASAPSYQFEIGPDGRQYAVAGEVNIDLAVVPGDPQATIVKMQKVKAAALAPLEPSSADRQVATEAAQRILEAQAELVRQSGTLNDPPAADADYWLEQAKKAENQQENSGRNNNIQFSSAFADAVNNQTPPVLPSVESRSLEQAILMQQRSQVISGFYQNAVLPQERPLLQMA